MENEEYRLHYVTGGDVVFPSKVGMKRHLENEEKIWRPFLKYLEENLKSNLKVRAPVWADWTPSGLASVFDSQIGLLEDRDNFNKSTSMYRFVNILPPRSKCLEGQLVLGLFANDMASHALAAYIYIIVRDRKIDFKDVPEIVTLVNEGRPLVQAAPILPALPHGKVSSAKIAGAIRDAENHIKSLEAEVVDAQEANAKHIRELDALLGKQKKEADRINRSILRLHRRNDRKQKICFQDSEQNINQKFEEIDKKIEYFKEESARIEEARVAEFERLQNLFATKLQFDEPSKLWGDRETLHNGQSASAFKWFMVTGGVAILFGLGVPYLYGDYIASSFTQLVCSTTRVGSEVVQECERGFSAKGPLTITGLLLVMSVLMWIARLQYRIHLSERHLALDASEKKAFAATFLAMKSDQSVTGDAEAIVLASLFRPTQDGIIRDDEGGLDVSAVALIAKQFSRSN